MDMRELVEKFLGPPDSASGKWSWWKCPKHAEMEASFGVDEIHGHCFSCSYHCGPTWFLRDVVGWTREMALQFVDIGLYQAVVSKAIELPPIPPVKVWRDAVGVLLGACQETLEAEEGAQGRQELESRQVKPDTWRRYKVGWSSTWVRLEEYDAWLAEGLVLPTFVGEKLWSVSVRTKRGRPKYCRVRGGQGAPFGIDKIMEQEILIVAEGEMDCLTASSAVPEAACIALRGTNNGLEQWREYFFKTLRGIIVMDGDGAGRAAAELLQYQFPSWENREPPEGMDLGDMAQEGMSIRSFLLEGYVL